MPYLAKVGKGAAQSSLLAAYVGAVRRKAGLGSFGMGDDTEVGDYGGDSTDTSVSITPFGSTTPIIPVTTGSSSVAPYGTCQGSGCGTETGISLTPAQALAQSGDTLSNIFADLAQGAQAGLKIFQQAQGPTVIGGVLYNPATGQYYNPTTGQVVNANGSSVAGSLDLSTLLNPTTLLIGGGLLFGILIISSMGRK